MRPKGSGEVLADRRRRALALVDDGLSLNEVARLIRREFRVRYHRNHVARLLRQLGWSYQKPQRRALERDEEAIDRWKRKNWPRVKKTLRGWVPTSSSSTSRVSS